MLPARPYLYLCALLLTGAAGCEEAREADLLDIASVGPSELDPGHPLVVEGGPFAIHHAVRVRLIGQLIRPFSEPEAIAEELPAQAVSEGRIEVAMPEATLRDRFGRATFRGRVEVREEARWGGDAGAVLGREPGVVIDFVPARRTETSERALDRVLGVTWATESERGIAVATVLPGGRGAALGLAAGDVLVGDGSALFVSGDAPLVPPSTTTLQLVVARPGEAERSVSCVLADHHEDDSARELARLFELAIVGAWIALLAALPLRSVEYAAPRVAPALARPSAALLARAACTVVLAYGVVRVVDRGLVPPLPLVVAALVGLRAALRFADARGDVRAVPRIALASVALAAGLALLPVAQGLADLASLAHDGTPHVLDWPMFAQPIGPLALALVGIGVATLRVEHRWLRPADDLLVVGVASVATLEGTGLAPSGRAGIVALAVTITLATWLLGHVRGRAHPTLATIGTGVALALAAIGLGTWTFADPPALLRRTAAETVLAMSIVLAIHVVRRATTARVPARTAHALL